jgi:hypothetical protein
MTELVEYWGRWGVIHVEACSMKVVCINNDGMSEHLTLGQIYRLDYFVGANAKIIGVEGSFGSQRFLIIDCEKDSSELVVGTVVSISYARGLGPWPGQIRQKDCPCGIPPGVLCEYHGS